MTRPGSIILAIVISGFSTIQAQKIINPSFGLVSHETLKISGLEFGSEETIIELTLENRTPGGYFCVDRKTVMQLPGGERILMLRSENIPNCPEVYNFRRVGEILRFRLCFPSTGELPQWFDLVEECSENCFSVLGIATDPALNEAIGQAYELAESGRSSDAGKLFREILQDAEISGHGLTASLYSNIIVMYLREGNDQQAKAWYFRMLNSSAPSLDRYVANLAARGIKW